MEESAYCTRCGVKFYRNPDERWKRLCLDCWKDKKNSATGSSVYSASGADYRTMYNRARDRAEQLIVENINLKMALEMAATVVGKEKQFLQTNIMTLITLCHPDKHGNSVASNDVTRELLGIRERMRQQ